MVSGINQYCTSHTRAQNACLLFDTHTRVCASPFHTALGEYSRGGVEPGALTFYILAILGNAAVPLMISKVQTLWEPQSVGRLVSWILLLRLKNYPQYNPVTPYPLLFTPPAPLLSPVLSLSLSHTHTHTHTQLGLRPHLCGVPPRGTVPAVRRDTVRQQDPRVRTMHTHWRK